MSDKYKASTKAALHKYLDRAAKKTARAQHPRKKNAKPELELETELRHAAKKMGIELAKVDSSAVYSKAAGAYIRGQTSESLPDLIGDDDSGHAIYAEIKAPGRRATLKPHQRAFLERKIKRGCFAGCFDRVDAFINLYNFWLMADRASRISMLLDDLPVKKISHDLDGSGFFG